MNSKEFKSDRPSVFAYFVYFFIFTSVLTACGSGGSSSSSTPVSVGVSGGAAKGTLANSTVTVFPVNPDGSRGTTPITTTTTDANGDFSLSLDPSQAVALVVTDGSYVDEATGGTIDLAPGEELEAYAQVPASGQIVVNITPLTTLAAAQAREHIANDAQALADAINNANAEISSVFDVGDVLATDLLAPTDLDSAIHTPQEINYSLLLAAISQLDANDAGQTAFDILSAIAADIEADGLWGNTGSETPPDLLTAKDQFLANNAGTVFEDVSSRVTNSLGQAVLDIEATGDTVNDAPVANNDTGTAGEGGSVTIDLAANDTDADNSLNLNSIAVGTTPVNGVVVINGDGTVDYTHDGSETVSDSFTYTIDDAGGATSNIATVNVTVTPVNDAPVANDDADTVNEGGSVVIDLAGNDSDAENDLDLTSINIVANPANGTIVAINTDGTVDYKHDGSETTSDSFTYTIDDNGGLTTNTATVTLTVIAGNDAPVANDDAGSVNEGGSVNIDLAGDDTDAEGALDVASIAIVANPTNGTIVTVNANGTVDYTHDGGETVSDSFTYTIDDALGVTSNIATVNVTVTPVNDAPVANDDADTVNEGGSVTIDLAGNDSDAENDLDLESINIVANPANGTIVAINTDGTVDYKHDGSETTSDSFTYTIDDNGGLTTNTATVAVTVNPVNDSPVASADSATVGQSASIIIDLAANDSDADSTLDLTEIVVSAASNGSLVDNDDGTVTYTHDGSFTTSDSFTYTIKDTPDGATSNSASVDVTVLEGFNEALFADPEVSSTIQDKRQYHANDGIAIAGNGWVGTEDVATGSSWIRLNFDSTKTIYRVVLTDVLDTITQMEAGSILFSDGTSIAISTPLPDDGTPVEFTFDPEQTDWVQINLTQAKNNFGLAEIAAYSTLDPGQTKQAEDLLNDVATTSDWTIVDDCDKGSPNWNLAFQFWDGAGNQYHQTGLCRGFSVTEGIELGTYLLWNQTATSGLDLRFSMRSDDNGTSTWLKGAMGVIFGYQDNNNYYRLDFSQLEGHRKLWKKVAGVYTELNASPQSYTLGDYPTSYTHQPWVNLRVVQKNGVIVVYADGSKVLAAADTTFTGGQVALLCARNESCTFDNVVLLDPPTDPVLGLGLVDGVTHLSGEYFVATNGNLDVSAVTTEATGVGGVEFVVDEGGAEESVLQDFAAPYSALFNAIATGEYTVSAYLLDGTATRLADSEASGELPLVGTGGIHLVGLGDSITSGLHDDVSADDTSGDGRNTSGGYQTVLNDHLTASNAGKPVTVLNEGNPGESITEASVRIAAVLARTPGAQAYLAIYGANDVGAPPTPHGLGTIPDTVDPVTFKDHMQVIINLVQAEGGQVILGKAPPRLDDLTLDGRIQVFNSVIDELVTENAFSYTPPDFHTYFTVNFLAEMNADLIHPNGIGYQSMGNLWCTAINGATELPGVLCSP